MPDLSAFRTAMRYGGWRNLHFSRYKGAQVAVFELDAGADDPATTLSGAYTTGSESAVRPGFLVRIYSSGGTFKGETRVRYGGSITSTSLPIREHSFGSLVILSTDVARIYAEVRPDAKIPTADANFNPDGIPAGTFGSDPPPMACSGGHWVGWVDGYLTGSPGTFATVTRADLSYPLDPGNTGGLTHLWILPTGVAFASGSMNTDAAPTLEADVNADGWLVEHIVTDADNSESTTEFIRIIVHNAANPPYECITRALDGDPAQDGWAWEVELFDAVDATNLPVGSPCMLWADEHIGGEWQSFGSPVAGTSHIKAVGYARRSHYQSEAGTETYSLEVVSPIGRYAELIGFSQVMIRDASPSTWQEVSDLTVGYAILRLWLFYSNLCECGYDFIVHAQYPEYPYPAFYIQRDNPRAQITELARGSQARMVCTRIGRFELQPIQSLMDIGARATLDDILELTRDDYLAIRMDTEQFETVGETLALAFTAVAPDPTPLRVRAPGRAPGLGSGRQEVNGLITFNLASLQVLGGQYHALFNKTFAHPTEFWKRFAPYIEVDLPLSYDGLDFYTGWVTLPFSTRLGDFDLSLYRYEIVRISVNQESGIITVGLQAETYGIQGADYPFETVDTDGLTPPPWDPIGFDPLLALNTIPSNVNNFIVFAVTDSGTGAWSLFTCTNFQDASPTFAETTSSSLSVTGYFVDAQQNPSDLTQWVVMTTAGVWVIDDAWGTPAVSASFDLDLVMGDVVNMETSGYLVARIHTHVAAPGFVVVQFWLTNAGTPSRDGYYLFTSTTFGSSWSGGKISSNVPAGGLFVSSHQAGVFFGCDDASGGRIIQYSNYGASSANLVTGTGQLMSIYIPHHNNSDDGVIFYSVFNGSGGTNVFLYDHGSVTNVTPFLQGGEGCGFNHTALDSASTDRTRLRGFAYRRGGDGQWFTTDTHTGSYTESDDGGDTWSGTPGAGQVYDVIAIAGDNPDVIFMAGRQGALVVSIDDGFSIIDKTGDLPTGTGGDMRIVRFGGNG